MNFLSRYSIAIFLCANSLMSAGCSDQVQKEKNSDISIMEIDPAIESASREGDSLIVRASFIDMSSNRDAILKSARIINAARNAVALDALETRGTSRIVLQIMVPNQGAVPIWAMTIDVNSVKYDTEDYVSSEELLDSVSAIELSNLGADTAKDYCFNENSLSASTPFCRLVSEEIGS